MTQRCDVCGGTDLVWTTRVGTLTRLLCRTHRAELVNRFVVSLFNRASSRWGE